MINLPAALFYIFLYLIGVMLLLTFTRKVPIWFIAVTGFAWGLLLWVVISTLCLLLSIPYNWITLTGLSGLAVLIILLVYIRSQPISLEKKKLMILLGGLALFSILSFVLTLRGYVFATADSLSFIILGQVLAEEGLVPWAVDQFADWGLLTPVLQMTAGILPGDFLSGYQTLLAFSLLTLFSILSIKALKKVLKPIFAILTTAGILAVLLSNLMIEHAFYLHANLPAAVFLFISLYLFSEYYRKGDREWLILAAIALTGFGFTRVEGPLYVILFLVLFISSERLDRSSTLTAILIYTIPSLIWYGYLLIFTTHARLLNKTNNLIILVLLLALILAGYFSSRFKWLRSKLPQITLLVLCLGIIVAISIKPDHMITSITNVVRNLANANYWGISWIVCFSFIPVFLLPDDQNPEERMVRYGIPGYLLLVLLVSFSRIPYRIGSTDSANRLLLQIQPVLYLFFINKADQFIHLLQPAKFRKQ